MGARSRYCNLNERETQEVGVPGLQSAGTGRARFFIKKASKGWSTTPLPRINIPKYMVCNGTPQ